VIDDAWVAPGTHVVAVGACRPTHREIDPRLVARSLVVADSRAAAMKESGDILLAIEGGLSARTIFTPNWVRLPAARKRDGNTTGKSRCSSRSAWRSKM
jgi:ornithine cyclodeaminase/alanine dehydrogenase-like protein (mu-crystallin family)